MLLINSKTMLNEVILFKYNDSIRFGSLKCFRLIVVLILIINLNSLIECKKSKISGEIKKFNSNSQKTESATFEPLNEEQILEIVQTHNELRNAVASGQKNLPKAANMIQMYWARALAKNAQGWLEKNGCFMEHSSGYKYKNQLVGENAAFIAGTNLPESPLKKMVNNWFDEIETFGNGNIDKFEPKEGTGHFTQLIWHNSYAVGCGFCKKQTADMNQAILVCQYAFVGNNVGKPIYEKGVTCKCPKGYGCQNKDYPSLCCPTKFNWCQKDTYLWFE